MGKTLIEKFRKIRPIYKITFLSAFLSGFLIHFYKLANTLLNHDSVYNFYSDQNVVGSGRWFLSIACGISSYFDLPWVNGLLSIVYISLTAVIIVALFRIENPITAILTSALLASFPGVTETLFFNFTADGYFLALLFSAYAVYVSRICKFSTPPRAKSVILSSVCICLSCGIYQAYVSFALVLSLCHLIYELFENRYQDKDYLRWFGRQIMIFLSAMIAYYGVWRLCLFFQNTVPSDYQGISEVSSFSFSSPITGVILSFRAFLLFFLQWNIFEHGITLYGALNVLLLLLFFMILLIAVKRSYLYQRKLQFTLLGLALVAFVPFSCIWCLFSEAVFYRPMMLLCLALVYILTGYLFDKWTKPKWSNLVGLFLCGIIFHNALIANISYSYMEQCNKKAYAESIEMMTRINYLDQTNEITNIAVIGDRIQAVQLVNDATTSRSSLIVTSGLEKSILYDSPHILLYLHQIHGLDLPEASREVRESLTVSRQVQEMGNWPAADSIQVLDSTLVIKLSNPADPPAK